MAGEHFPVIVLFVLVVLLVAVVVVHLTPWSPRRGLVIANDG
ncbi:hypothetical protein ACH4TM_10060 [Streptomyces parvus]|nr:hypothetical protein [Streptomyces sp. CS149]